jgi:molybdate transport system permease protein
MHALFVPLWLTLKVALLATLIAGVIGIALGWWLARRPFPGRSVVDSLLMLPMVLPPTVIGYYLIVLIGRNGILGQYLDRWFGINLIFTWQGAVIAASVVSLPLVYKGARAAFEEVDGRFANAARTLGAGELEVFLRVSLPLAIRGIAAGVMLAFARAMGEFGATLMIAGNLPGKTQTLPLFVYVRFEGADPAAAIVLSLALMAVSLAVLLALRDRWLGLR